MADRIELKGLKAYGYHGVFAEEKANGQEFLCDITCWLDFSGVGDDLTRTVHYGELTQLAHDVLVGPSKDLIEAVANEIADKALAEFPPLLAIEVTIHKPNAPIPLPFDDVAVVARRSRK